MEFFKVKSLRRSRKSKSQQDPDPETDQPPSPAQKDASLDPSPTAADGEEEDDDDDFITNEVKRRLKELRKNSFMVLIPEESPCPEDGETSSGESRESEAEEGQAWCRFDALYDEYCNRMLFFDKMRMQYLKEAGSWNVSNQSPRSTSKQLTSMLKSLSFKRRGEPQEDYEHLQQPQEDDPCQKLETAYVAHVSLTWEALQCQYMQLSQRLKSQPEDPTSYCYAAQAFQQFQVLLQRFVENEPFEQGSRVEIYSYARTSLPKLLQAPIFKGMDEKENEGDYLVPPILAADLLHIMEESILTFHTFLKLDKKKSGGALHLLRVHNQAENPLQQIQASLDKKKIKVKELLRKKGWKKKSWPATLEAVELLFGLIDIRVVSRALRMARISKEQLLWCDEKMSKLELMDNKLRRDGSPILFPC